MRALIIALMAAASMEAAIPRVDVDTIVRLSVQANNRDWQAAPGYNYFERDRVTKGTRTYQVSMLFGSPYRRLVAVNGKSLMPAQQREEQRRLDEAIARRRAESQGQKDARLGNYQQDRRRDHLLIAQLTEAFTFKLMGQQQLGTRTVYVLQAMPRPGYRPPNRDSKALTGMQGELWIDTQTFQWVKVEAHVVHPVWIEGFLARVSPGTRFELEYAPVSADVWLPTHFATQSSAKIFLLFPHHGKADESYFGYEKAASRSASESAN